ncbi:microtubule-associated protein futsch-like [Uloborus diversus]|uniref:microtubule-associated protein futsch-like n=1 Tax=Uloborus diversus TaxID=327109 RepID=UPI002409C5E2|nr:microtubule-associated protein futsch-like [Uloborus diversus]
MMEGGGTPYASGMAPSGSYILVIVSEPVNDQHKEVILERLNKGLLSWDVESTGCDLSGLESVCSSINSKTLSDNDVLIQYSTESLGVEVLVNPTVSTFKQCVKNLFSTSTGHKHLIHAGYTFSGSGSWMLQNGTFSFDEFLEIFQQADVQSQKRCNINVHCAEVGMWNASNFAKDIFTKIANIALNPPGKVDKVPGSEHLMNALDRVLSSQALEEMMEASPLVGNIRFNRPTLYLFPAGQGDCALFGINGFNMLIDGGFNRRPCSWEFIRHLDRLDAVLVTRLCENNLCGMNTLMKRKALNNTYPQIGYVFCNIAENKTPSTKEENLLPQDDLTVSVVREGHNFVQTLNDLKLKPHQCWRDSAVEPFVLYHKVGHGTLEMHVLSPPRDSKEMKEFLTEWNAYKETFSCIKSGLRGKGFESSIPLSHSTSICALLVWRPADPKDTISRILFPGSAPQNKIFESLEKLKTLDILNQPVVTKASLTTILVAKPISHKVEKSVSRASIPNRKNTASPALSTSSVASRNGDIGGIKKENKEIKKVVKEVKKEKEIKNNKEVKEVKKEIKKESLTKQVKKDTKTETIVKKELVKKDITKEVKKDNKDIKKVVKKDKEIKVEKPLVKGDKASDLKSATKKIDSASNALKTVGEIKKSTTVKKTTTTTVKKDIGKPPVVPKTNEVKKTAPVKTSDAKVSKDKPKTTDSKSVPKTKPKTPSTTPKTTPKAKPSAVSTPGGKVTKAVAASSVVASVVAVTAAAVELNEKQDEVVEPEAVAAVQDTKVEDIKEVNIAEKTEEEMRASPLPLEASSPTPSDSVSLTPSDTLSSAPLETVSPTPPLANEPVSMEEKEVNEIKDFEQDPIPYETEAEINHKNDEADEPNMIELELAKRAQLNDAMSTSFVGGNDFDEMANEEILHKDEAVKEETMPMNFSIPDYGHNEEIKHDFQGTAEKDNEYMEDLESKEINAEDPLAQMTMEGSFCAGMISNEREGFNIENNELLGGEENEINESVISSEMHMTSKEEIIHEKYDEKESVSPKYDHEEAHEVEYSEKDIQQMMSQSMHEAYSSQDDQLNVEELHKSELKYEAYEPQEKCDVPYDTNALEADEQYKEIQQHGEEKFNEHDIIHSDAQDQVTAAENVYEETSRFEEKKNPYEERYSQIESMYEQVGCESFDRAQNIIDDLEMQESSVDEPEEIVRRESSVSITFNDEAPEGIYDDKLRRKSGTESEDDVDIQNFMSKETKSTIDQSKLSVQQQDSESDDEDVVKSPTPHAVVDYEGNLDQCTLGAKSHDSDKEFEVISEDKVLYSSEKQDFDEKDRDSAEESEDADDGEMIRHPTPPHQKYSEDEMRDPIGQHFITTPNLIAQGSGISEQPLYEEAEEDGSEMSHSPVVEQPIFGNAVEADFPELVTVSGGTTPSEPQSPKANFDSKKLATEAGIMEALSEHDISESSTHSPSCQEGSTAFELPISEKNTLEDENIQSISSDRVSEINASGFTTSDIHFKDDQDISDIHSDMKQEKSSSEKADAPSDDESCSDNDKSESHSEGKSDVEGDDKSDIPHDKSDCYGDDKSDHQHDGKPDAFDDEQVDHRSDACDDYQFEKKDYDACIPPKDFEHQDIQKDSHLNAESDYHYDSKSCAQQQDETNEEGERSSKMHEDTKYNDLHATEMQSESSILQNIQSEYQGTYCDLQEDNKSDVVEDTKDSRDECHDDIETDFYSNKSNFNEETSNTISVEQHGKPSAADYICNEPSCDSTTFNENLQSTGYNFGEDTNIASHAEVPEIPDQEPISVQDIKVDVVEDKFPGLTQEAEFAVGHENLIVHPNEMYTEERIMSGDDYHYSYSEKETTENIFENQNLGTPAEFSSEKLSEEEKYGKLPFDQHENETYRGHVDLHEDISPQHVENLTVIENKILSETTEAHQYEVLSQYEENTCTSNQVYSETSSSKNILSEESHYEVQNVYEEQTHEDDANFNYVSQETKAFTSDYSYQYPLSANDSNSQPSEYAYHAEVDSYAIGKDFESNFHKNNGLETDFHTYSESKEIINSNDQSHYAPSEGYLESFSTKPFSSEILTDVHEDEKAFIGAEKVMEDIAQSDYGDAVHSVSEMVSEKNHSDYEFSESTRQVVTETSSFTKAYAVETENSEHEANYAANRFHSDSPEDNAMRTDSSPEIPYPLEPNTEFTELKNSVLLESHGVPFNQMKEDFPNLNLPNAGTVPLSPNNQTRNSNRETPYDESSDEEDSSSLPGTVSPYAYTNKAYTREEEDIDGNHLYKESIALEQSNEVIKQVEFDGNNPQTLSTTTHQVTGFTQGYQEAPYSADNNYDFRLEEWGKPMGLPTPPDSSEKKSVLKKSGLKSTGKAAPDSRASLDNGKAYSPSVASKLSSPLKKPKPKSKESSSSHVYVDLAYVPHHGDPQYCDVEFFKKIRARYYVFSSINPSKEVLNALLEAKKSWNEDLDVTIIPTYETDTLGYWMAQNQDDLAEYSIEVAPSASRCTVNLQDHETSCAAYRLEF